MSRPQVSLEGKQALVLGLGVHGGGAGVARFLVEHGARVTVTDLRPPEKLAEGLESLRGLPIEYVLGEHQARDVLAADLIVRNPAVPRESPWLRLAREHEIPVLMEMNLFWAFCPAPITAITGSKGKSTTTAWLGHVLRLSRPDTVVAGNLRVSALDALPLIRSDTPVVLELSSWQLESFAETRIGPHVSCVTNLAPDHLDRYRDMAEYAEAKREIYRYQRGEDVAVFNHDDPLVRRFASDCPAQVRWFGTEDHAGMGGVLTARDLVLRSTETVQPIIRLEDLALAGRHNALNAAAVATLAAANNIPPEQIAEGLRTFPGLPDRMEFVAEINGVRYINDTTSTVPASTIAALSGVDGRVVLIAGGASKRVPFGELAELICHRVSRLVLLEGSATPELQTEVYKRCPTLETSLHHDLQSAVEVAHGTARPGDTVLFSPACASFGMFDNEFQRGELFRQAVRRLRGSGQEARDGG
ncbi:MAG: UDP-N-acetylmuramoyl-L-alanine--D-glutamate ligase [Chloroflexota bacterium]|nr:UDP-N-acetylmuramoyl-L-alanine--D-glutamate ligase [Chloroflexota bacterium]